MEAINTYSVYVISWFGTYLIHSTLIFLTLKVILKIFSCIEAKELILRFAMFGGVFTSLIQLLTEPGSSNDPFVVSNTTYNFLGIVDASEHTEKLNWSTTLLIIWIFTSLTLVIRHMILVKSFLKSTKPLIPLTPSQITKLNQHKDIIGTEQRIDFMVSPKSTSPFVYGTNRMVIPSFAFSNLDNNEFKSMLAHEAMHLIRRDWYWLQAYKCFKLIFFFQPLNWLLFQELIQISESNCDTRAVRLTKDKKALANSILQIASWKSEVGDNLAPGLAFSPTSLSKRIDNVLDIKHAGQPSRKWKVILIQLFLSILFVTAVPGFHVEKLKYALPTSSNQKPHTLSDSLPQQGEEYMIEIPVPVEVDTDVPLELDVNLEVENEIELNPL